MELFLTIFRPSPVRIINIHFSNIPLFLFKSDADDRELIVNSMQKLMYDVATPVDGSDTRDACVYFRPRESTDKTYFKIQYGNGCSAHVSGL
jgi:hypothetical protein